MSRRLKALALATSLAIPAEGLYLAAYRDPVGIPTICFGATRGVQMGDRKTREECEALLDADMLAAIDQVERCVPGLPVGPLAAFSDAVYNIGPRIACNTETSTAARLLKAGRIADACNQLPLWNKARIAGFLVPLPGLSKRREAERLVCLSS
ncbi:lysozyme [Methylobacillus sp. Pita2]|uniref:lysozyme n=1 Tax=Methylobacillus sp. Pita2 TaxID=3383245 RepID=UPI0038B65160